MPPSFEQNYGVYNHYSPNSIMTPNENGYGNISDGGSVAEFPLSQENKGGFSNNMGSITDTQHSVQSFSFPNSIFKK